MSRWRKRNASSPGNWGRSERISSCRTSAARRGSTSGSSGASAWTAPRWKISPSTAPRSSTERSCGSSWSRRAVRSALSVGGTSSTSPSPASATISVMKSGLPPVLSAIRRRASSGTDSPISASASPGWSGSSLSGADQDGRRWSSSGRAMHSSSTGAPAETSAVDSTSSRNVSSPHCRSSKQTTIGACSSRSFRNAQAISSALVGRSLSRSSDRNAPAASSSEGRARSCFTTSTTGQYVMPSPYGRQRPRTTRASMRSSASATRRDLPTPASPITVTSSQREAVSVRSHVSRSACSSCPRPTNGQACERSGAPRTVSSRKAGTGSDFPFNVSGSTGSTATASRTSASVGSPTSTSPGSAACSSRAATLTASPVASRSSVPVTTSPVLTPIRPWMPSSANASRISTAARHARSASSSCAVGTPNTAMTASPMNFSTVPPCDSTIPFIRSK